MVHPLVLQLAKSRVSESWSSGILRDTHELNKMNINMVLSRRLLAIFSCEP